MYKFDLGEDLTEEFITDIQDLNKALDAYAQDEREYEDKLFASSCEYDGSNELPF